MQHALGKPFSDANCAAYFAEMGAILTLLPPPPAKLLDLGCGTGWTSSIFAKAGYKVTGVDIAPDMIRHARQRCDREAQPRLQFLTADYEEMHGEGKFDAVVFFDALHHAVDEVAALRCAYLALKPGGICVACEPGCRHSHSAGAREAVQRYNVTEKGMPPLKIVRAARRIGFRDFRVYPHASRIQREVFARTHLLGPSVLPGHNLLRALRFGAHLALGPWRLLRRTARLTVWNEVACWASGITVLVK